MRQISAALLLALALGFCASASSKSQDPVDRAREHAEHASPKGEAKADIELVIALVNRAGELYSAQKFSGSTAAIEEAQTALAKGRSSAQEHRHDIKQCDLMLNHLERRLKDDLNSFATQDRPPVQALLKQVQDTRDELLKILFEK